MSSAAAANAEPASRAIHVEVTNAVMTPGVKREDIVEAHKTQGNIALVLDQDMYDECKGNRDAMRRMLRVQQNIPEDTDRRKRLQRELRCVSKSRREIRNDAWHRVAAKQIGLSYDQYMVVVLRSLELDKENPGWLQDEQRKLLHYDSVDTVIDRLIESFCAEQNASV